MTLTPEESRVLGVLVEKETTTPDQYPLSLNAIVNGCNQKNNRDPVLSLDEGTVYTAVEGLRVKKLVVLVDQMGSRVNKYRHNAAEVLRVTKAGLAILAELLLRGPQTLGELRGRASRMAPLENLDAAKEVLRTLMTGETPLVKEIPPTPGSRAERYLQLLCAELHDVGAGESSAQVDSSAPVGTSLASRVETLEKEVAWLKEVIEKLTGEKPTAEAGGVGADGE